MNKHDKVIKNLESRLKNNGWEVINFEEYIDHNTEGELDLYATKNNYRLLFSVSDTVIKRKFVDDIGILCRLRHYFYDNYKTYAFLVKPSQNKQGYEINKLH